jgi:hypothetical protein
VIYKDAHTLYSMADTAPLVVKSMLTPTAFLLLGGFSMSAALNKYEIDLQVGGTPAAGV